MWIELPDPTMSGSRAAIRMSTESSLSHTALRYSVLPQRIRRHVAKYFDLCIVQCTGSILYGFHGFRLAGYRPRRDAERAHRRHRFSALAFSIRA